MSFSNNVKNKVSFCKAFQADGFFRFLPSELVNPIREHRFIPLHLFLLPSQLNTWQKQISCQGEAWKFIKGVLQIVQNSSIYSMPKVSFTCWETINFLTKELSNQWRPKFTSKARTLRHTFLKDGRDRTERLATGILWVVVEPAWVPSAYPAVRKWH